MSELCSCLSKLSPKNAARPANLLSKWGVGDHSGEDPRSWYPILPLLSYLYLTKGPRRSPSATTRGSATCAWWRSCQVCPYRSRSASRGSTGPRRRPTCTAERPIRASIDQMKDARIAIELAFTPRNVVHLAAFKLASVGVVAFRILTNG